MTFQRQLAVIKGQAWNIVESLRHLDEGPLELTRRAKVLVWDDELDDEALMADLDNELHLPEQEPESAPLPATNVIPIQRSRSHSISGNFPPAMRRASTESPRPVPFTAKFPRVHPGTTGVVVLEHLERLDAVEARLQRISGRGSMEDSLLDEEMDVGEASNPRRPHSMPNTSGMDQANRAVHRSPTLSPAMRRMPTLSEADSDDPSHEDDGDVGMLSKSMTHATLSAALGHSQERNRAMGLDWMLDNAEMQSSITDDRPSVVERLEMVQPPKFASFTC